MKEQQEQNEKKEDEENGLVEVDEPVDASIDAIVKKKTVINAADIVINPFTYTLNSQENNVIIDQINVTGIPDEKK